MPSDTTVQAKAIAALREARLDAVVGMSPENATYLAGVAIPSQMLIRSRLVMALIAANGVSRHVVADMEEPFARAETALDSVVAYNEFTETPAGKLAATLEELGLHEARIGLETDYVPAAFFEELQTLVPKAGLVHATPLLDELRIIKTPWEVDRLRSIGRIAARAHVEAYAKYRPGMTELDLASNIYDSVLRNGGEALVKLVVGSGPRCTQANPGPTTRVMAPGEMVRVDIFASEKSYLSDVARTAVVGSPTAEQKRMWSWTIEALKTSLDMIRPGASTRAIYERFVEYTKSRGLRPINFLGHGLGLSLHEEPYFNRFSDITLQPGMVLCVEPYFMMPEVQQGYQIEEEVLVTGDGFELLTDVGDNERLFVL